MEPISVALAAVAAIKSGVQMGKDISTLGKEVGQLWGAIDQVKSAHNKKKSGRGSVEEEALSTFIDAKRAQDLEDELRQIIIYTRGMNAWQELLRLRGQIRKERQAQEAARRRRNRQILEITIGAILLSLGIVGLAIFVLFLIERHTARGG